MDQTAQEEHRGIRPVDRDLWKEAIQAHGGGELATWLAKVPADADRQKVARHLFARDFVAGWWGHSRDAIVDLLGDFTPASLPQTPEQLLSRVELRFPDQEPGADALSELGWSWARLRRADLSGDQVMESLAGVLRSSVRLSTQHYSPTDLDLACYESLLEGMRYQTPRGHVIAGVEGYLLVVVRVSRTRAARPERWAELIWRRTRELTRWHMSSFVALECLLDEEPMRPLVEAARDETLPALAGSVKQDNTRSSVRLGCPARQVGGVVREMHDQLMGVAGHWLGGPETPAS